MAINRKVLTYTGLFTLASLLWLQSPAWSAPGDKASPPATTNQKNEATQLAARREALVREQQKVADERSEVESLIRNHEARLKTLAKEGVGRTVLEQAAFEADTLKLRVQSLEVEQEEVRRSIEDLEAQVAGLSEQVKALRGNATGSAAANNTNQLTKLQGDLETRQAELRLEKDRLTHVQTAYQVAKEHYAASSRWFQSLQQLYLAQQELSHAEALDQLQSRIQKEQQDIQKQADDFRYRLTQVKGDDNKARAERSLLETQIHSAEERIRQKQVDLNLAQVKNRLNNLVTATQGTEVAPASLKGAFEQAEALMRDLEGSHHLLVDKIKVLEEKKQLLEKRLVLMPDMRKEITQENQVVDGLIKELQQRLNALQAGIQSAKDQRDQAKSRYDQSVERSLKVRRRLPPDMVAWKEAVLELLMLPRLYSQQGIATAKQIAVSIDRNGTSLLSLLVLLELAWLLGMAWLRGALRSVAERFRKWQERFWARLVLLVLELLLHSIPLATILGAAVMFLLLVESPQPATSTVVTLAITALILNVLLDLTKLLLAAPTLPSELQQPVLYRKLRWILWLTGLFTGLHLLVHYLPTSLTIKDLVNRLFMLLLLLLDLLAWRSRRLILALLGILFAGRALWIKASEWISLLLPATVLIALLLGLVGYVNLALTLGGYVGWFLVVLVGWLLMHGLLQDLATALQTRITTTDSQWADWTQGLVDPLQRVVQWVLFVVAWVVLFQLFGWDAESPAVRVVSRGLGTPLFSVGGRGFSIFDLLLTGAIIVGVVLAARWSREVTHRWVFSRVADPGTRHSLSVFTQYAVVLFGVLTALRVLGIDLTTFAIFAGALGVGVGLGLQGIANNFISGILLLIERPLRTGDYVTIGKNEGLVTRIGIRSLTVKSADNQEIIIPNADVISNEFTNWTHSDTVVRLKLEVGISYDNDPAEASRIMAEALADDPLVLESPLPRVWLKDYGESSVNFMIHYFIDMNKCTIWESKSKVLFAIWDRFKAADIQIPYPHREIIIRGDDAERTGKKKQHHD
jgi:potassium-dependent mechanosensitive channel